MSNRSIPTSVSEPTRPRHWVLIILTGAIALGWIAFYGCNFLATQQLRHLTQVPNGDLEWLRREFHLSDAQFKAIADLHLAYTPICNEMCRRIVEANTKIDRLVSENREMTIELETAIREAGNVQQDCRTQMLAHIYRVSALMNPTDGERYLNMMKSRVIEPALSSDSAVRQANE
jgi:hypothetical protein